MPPSSFTTDTCNGLQSNLTPPVDPMPSHISIPGSRYNNTDRYCMSYYTHMSCILTVLPLTPNTLLFGRSSVVAYSLRCLICVPLPSLISTDIFQRPDSSLCLLFRQIPFKFAFWLIRFCCSFLQPESHFSPALWRRIALTSAALAAAFLASSLSPALDPPSV